MGKEFENWWNDNTFWLEDMGGTCLGKAVWMAALEWAEDIAAKNRDKNTLVEIIRELESNEKD